MPPGQASACPNVVGGQFQGQWGYLVQNQMFILMHEILHFYLGNAPGPAKNSATEINDINEAVGLGAVDAISNAQSFVFYAASKCRGRHWSGRG